MSTFKVAFTTERNSTTSASSSSVSSPTSSDTVNPTLSAAQSLIAHSSSFHRIQFPENTTDLFSKLYDHIAHLYKTQFSKKDEDDYEFVLRYIDEENDVCAITSNGELSEAIRQVAGKTIKIYATSIKVDDFSSPPASPTHVASNLVSSLNCDPVSEYRVENSLSPSISNLPPTASNDLGSFNFNVDKFENKPILDDDIDYVNLFPSNSNLPSTSISWSSVDEKQDDREDELKEPLEEQYNIVQSSNNLTESADFDVVPDLFATTKEFQTTNNEGAFVVDPPIAPSEDSTERKTVDSSKKTADVSIANEIKPVQTSSVEHQPFTSTSNCSEKPQRVYFCRRCFSKITDVLFKCVNCRHFSLCQVCEAKGEHPLSHALIKVRTLSHANIRFAKKTAKRYLYSKSPNAVPIEPRVFEFDPSLELDATITDTNHNDCITIKAGESITKLWTITNSGGQVWPIGTQLRFVGGTIALQSDSNNEQLSIYLPTLKPSEKIDLSVLILVNNEPGTYHGSFGIYTADGVCFGQESSIVVTVEAESVPTASATAQPDDVASQSVSTDLPTSTTSTAASHTIPSHIEHTQSSKTVQAPVAISQSAFSANSSTISSLQHQDAIHPRIYPIVSPSSGSNNDRPRYEDELQQLISMGFDVDVSRYMIILHKGDVDAALNALLRR